MILTASVRSVERISGRLQQVVVGIGGAAMARSRPGVSSGHAGEPGAELGHHLREGPFAGSVEVRREPGTVRSMGVRSGEGRQQAVLTRRGSDGLPDGCPAP